MSNCNVYAKLAYWKETTIHLFIIVSSVKGLWAQAMDNIRQKLADYLPDQVDEDLFGCPFEGLETQYLQQKYYQENFSYIVSSVYV